MEEVQNPFLRKKYLKRRKIFTIYNKLKLQTYGKSTASYNQILIVIIYGSCGFYLPCFLPVVFKFSLMNNVFGIKPSQLTVSPKGYGFVYTSHRSDEQGLCLTLGEVVFQEMRETDSRMSV